MDRNIELAIDAYVKSNALGYGTDELKAVVWTESAGVLFWNVGGKQVPAIRFEGHHFYRRLKGEKLKRAVKEGLAAPGVGAVKNPNGWAARYALFERACKIDATAAIASTSWGIGQVMGFNFKECGLSSPQDVMTLAMRDFVGQVELMVRFIQSANLVGALKSRNWKVFAKGYNGPAYKKNAYDKKMAEAYAMFAKYELDGHIFLVQEKLKKLELYKGEIDGHLGPLTSNAVKSFQQAAGLTVDGVLGSVTTEQLDNFVTTKKSADNKSKLPAVSAVGTIAAMGIPQIMEVVATSKQISTQTRELLSMFNLAPAVVGIALAGVTAFVVYKMVKGVKIDTSKLDTLEIAKGINVQRNTPPIPEAVEPEVVIPEPVEVEEPAHEEIVIEHNFLPART